MRAYTLVGFQESICTPSSIPVIAQAQESFVAFTVESQADIPLSDAILRSDDCAQPPVKPVVQLGRDKRYCAHVSSFRVKGRLA